MSSDGRRHEGDMEAPDKDSVYSELRKRGIRAIKVQERIVPVVRSGFGGLRKRDWSIIAIIGLTVVSLVVIVGLREGSVGNPESPTTSTSQVTTAPGVVSAQIALPRPRHYINGLPNIDEVFRYPHERFLARFACPGVLVNKLAVDEAIQRDFFDHLGMEIQIYETDSDAVAELKRIVAGMKDDARKYLNVPEGIPKLCAWLHERQEMELAYRDRFVGRVRKGEISVVEVNDVFRAMGLQELDLGSKSEVEKK